MAIAWIKDGQSLDEARFQMLDVFGTPRFSDQGQPLISSSDGVPVFGRSVAVCEDGNDGFFADVNVVIDNNEQLRVVHLNSAGEHVANPEGVQPFGIRPEIEGTSLNCTPDGDGGCFVSATVYNQHCCHVERDNASERAMRADLDSSCDVLGTEPRCEHRWDR